MKTPYGEEIFSAYALAKSYRNSSYVRNAFRFCCQNTNRPKLITGIHNTAEGALCPHCSYRQTSLSLASNKDMRVIVSALRDILSIKKALGEQNPSYRVVESLFIKEILSYKRVIDNLETGSNFTCSQYLLTLVLTELETAKTILGKPLCYYQTKLREASTSGQ